MKYVPEKMSVLYLLLQSCAGVPGVSATFTRELLLSLRKSPAIWASFKATWKKTRVWIFDVFNSKVHKRSHWNFREFRGAVATALQTAEVPGGGRELPSGELAPSSGTSAVCLGSQPGDPHPRERSVDNAAPVERDHTSHPRPAARRGGRRARPTPPPPPPRILLLLTRPPVP